jgi:hypothetical protein
MANNLSFDAATFLALSVEERVELCKRSAKRAQELADTAGPNYRASYLDIAKNWLQLADEMERVSSMENSK